MSDTVLVTGGGGFVGSAVVRRLVGAVHDGTPPRFADGTVVRRVIALLRQSSSAERLDELPSGRAWSIERADLADPRALARVVSNAKPRAIVHAALPDGGACDPVSTLATLFRALQDVPGARLIHTGSAWVLAPGHRLAEEALVDPRSDYARAKLREDQALPALGEGAGVEWINLRLFNVFGKYEQPSRLVPYLVRRLTGGEIADLSHGSQVRDFTDVDAIADAYLLALRAPPAACDILYHVGSGRPTTARELALIVAELVGDPSLLSFGGARTDDDELPSLVADPSRAREALGWAPSTELRYALERVVAWWLDRPHLQPRPVPSALGALREDSLP